VPVPLLISNPNGIITFVGSDFPLLSPATALIFGTGRRPEHATHPSREAAYGGGRARKTHGIKKNKQINKQRKSTWRSAASYGGFLEERKVGNGEEGLSWVEVCCVDVCVVGVRVMKE